ncbi:MAG: tRNA (guanine(10)-N(2))-dimethyltransferase [Candidatus Bathyarchaeia archaeon]
MFNFPVEIVREGAVNIVVPYLEAFKKAPGDYAPSKAPVFYNPRMRLNRDIAVLALQTYQRIVGRELSVSEPLAGCGVRGIRFAKEVKGIRRVYLNDINSEAFKMAQHNVHLNKLTHIVSGSNEDANLFLSQHAAPKKRFDYVDIDPFGSPVTYIDSGLRATRDGGLLALTATDMASLCGVYPKTALRKYGGLSLKTEYCHELAVRLLAGCLAATAAKHDIGISIPFSHSTDHYIRVYALVSYGAKKADESIRNMGYIYHCFQCFHRETINNIISPVKEQCSECGAHMKVSGPLWLGKIAEKEFCENMEKEASLRNVEPKIMKILSLIKSESDEPTTYYVVDKICDKLGVPVPSLISVIKKLRGRCFVACPTHFHARGVKTNASAKNVCEVIKEIAK